MINLLPIQEKKEILTEQRLKLILIFEVGLSLFLVSSLLTLFSTQIYLQGEINSNEIVIAQREKEVPAKLISDFQQEIKELNGELERVESFYEGQVSLTDVLKDVFQKLPTGSYLASFSFVRDLGQKKINLVGFVPSREKLLDLKRSLEADPRFDRVDLPPGNWVSATNIDFYLSLELK